MTAHGLTDVDAIRPPTPRLDRAWLVGLALIAVGSFASGFIERAIGPLTLQPQVEQPVPAIAAAPPPPPVVQPSMQVAAAEPARKPAPKLEPPGPVVVAPAPPVVAATIEAAPAPALVVPDPAAAPPAEPVAEAEEPPAA
jgi:hypothetical protein